MTASKLVVLAALLFPVLAPNASVAQSPVVAQWKVYVLESCGKEIKRSCKTVAVTAASWLASILAKSPCRPNVSPQSQRRSTGSRDLMRLLPKLSEFANPMQSDSAAEWWPVTAI